MVAVKGLLQRALILLAFLIPLGAEANNEVELPSLPQSMVLNQEEGVLMLLHASDSKKKLPARLTLVDLEKLFDDGDREEATTTLLFPQHLEPANMDSADGWLYVALFWRGKKSLDDEGNSLPILLDFEIRELLAMHDGDVLPIDSNHTLLHQTDPLPAYSARGLCADGGCLFVTLCSVTGQGRSERYGTPCLLLINAYALRQGYKEGKNEEDQIDHLSTVRKEKRHPLPVVVFEESYTPHDNPYRIRLMGKQYVAIFYSAGKKHYLATPEHPSAGRIVFPNSGAPCGEEVDGPIGPFVYNESAVRAFYANAQSKKLYICNWNTTDPNNRIVRVGGVACEALLMFEAQNDGEKESHLLIADGKSNEMIGFVDQAGGVTTAKDLTNFKGKQSRARRISLFGRKQKGDVVDLALFSTEGGAYVLLLRADKESSFLTWYPLDEEGWPYQPEKD